MSLLEAISKARASGDPELIALADWAAAKLPAEHPHRLRDRLLRACAALPNFNGMSTTSIAREIEAGWQRYAASAGDRERGFAECPRHRLGQPSQYYFELHRAGFPPLRYRRLLDIL